MKVEHTNDRLFSQLRGKKLRRVLTELGFPEVPPTVFESEHVLTFQQHMAKLPTSHQDATAQLVRSLHSGRVSELQTQAEGKTKLTVDFDHLGYRCSVQLLHWREHWEMTKAPTMLKASRQLAVPFMVTGVFAVLVLGSVVLWSMNGSKGDLEGAIQLVEAEGYVVMTPEQKNDIVAVAEENGYNKAQQELASREAPDDEDAKDNDEAKDDDGDEKEEAKTFTFTMKDGMTSEDLTSALKENGLIDDEIDFSLKLASSGIDRKVRPGEYTFSSEMSEEEIMRELEND